MHVLEVVATVLAQTDGTPLPYRDITRRILDAGLWQTTGLTPEYTVKSQLNGSSSPKDVGALDVELSPTATLSFTDAAERFSRAYDTWEHVQSYLAAMGNEGWEAISLVPVVIEARPVSTRMHFYLVMKRRVPEEPGGEWPKPRLVTDGDK